MPNCRICGNEITVYQDTHHDGKCPACALEQRYRDRGRTPPAILDEADDEKQKVRLRDILLVLGFAEVMGIGFSIGFDTFSGVFGGNLYIDLGLGVIFGILIFIFFYFFIVE